MRTRHRLRVRMPPRLRLRLRIELTAFPRHANRRGGAVAGAAPGLRRCSARYGTTRLVRIISESSCELMWQCHTYGPEVTGS